jgi:hypothetical protein
MRAILKVTSGELIPKQAARKRNVLYTKNTYILKPLLNVVTARTETLVILRSKFLYACVKEVCHL